MVGAAADVVGAGLPGGEEEADGGPSADVGPLVPLPVEQPEAMATKAPAAAMLIPRDAIVWVLRMVNRKFVGVGFPSTSLPRADTTMPRADASRSRPGHLDDYAEAAAAASAAAGRASMIRFIAASSCAADKNQASKTDGGRYTPESSIEWKNGA